jgi:hypothetical protein
MQRAYFSEKELYLYYRNVHYGNVYCDNNL